MSLEKVSWKVMSLVLFVANDCLHPGVVGSTKQNPTRFLPRTDVHDVVRTFCGDLLRASFTKSCRLEDGKSDLLFCRCTNLAGLAFDLLARDSITDIERAYPSSPSSSVVCFRELQHDSHAPGFWRVQAVLTRPTDWPGERYPVATAHMVFAFERYSLPSFQRNGANYRSVKRRKKCPNAGNIYLVTSDNYCVRAMLANLVSSSVYRGVAGWRLVRTHAADAARALPRRSTSRPLGAPLLPCEPSPDPEPLGANASRRRQIGGAADALR